MTDDQLRDLIRLTRRLGYARGTADEALGEAHDLLAFEFAARGIETFVVDGAHCTIQSYPFVDVEAPRQPSKPRHRRPRRSAAAH